MVAEPVSRQVDLDRLDEPLERIIERAAAADERIVLRRHGVVLALVVPAAGPEPADAHLPHGSRDVLAEASRRFADIPWQEVEAQIGRAVEEVRREGWHERHSDG